MNIENNKNDETLLDNDNVHNLENENSVTPKEKESAGKHVASAAAGAAIGSAAGSAGVMAANNLATPATEVVEEKSMEEDDAPEEEIEATIDNSVYTPTQIPTATNVTDDMTFGEAFAAARRELGAGGVFYWRGNAFNTYHREEWAAMSAEQQTSFANAIPPPPVATQHNHTHLAMQEATPVNLSEPIHGIEILQKEINGQVIDFAVLNIDGEDIAFLDVDRDGTIDFIITESGEVEDLRPPTFEDVAQLQRDIDRFNAQNDYLANNNLPDYTNDGAVDNFLM